MTRKTLLAVGLTVCGGVALAAAHTVRAGGILEPERSVPKPTVSLDDDAQTVIEGLAARAAEGWGKEDLAPEDVEDLRGLLQDILLALTEPDFDKYHELMEERGARLDVATAEALAEKLLPLYDAPPEVMTGAVVDQLRHIWESPSLRHAEWRAVAPEHVVCDAEFLNNLGNWPPGGISGQFTLYTPFGGSTADFRLSATIDERQLSRARVRFPVEFTSGEVVYVEFGFYKYQADGADDAQWFPDRYFISNTTAREQRPKLLI